MATIRKEDVQDIVGEVRDMLELRNNPTEAELQRLFQKYVSVVQQVNSILKKCLELIEKGRKSDAIMRADENNLLETVSILDFPEQPEWIAYVMQFGLAMPPEVDQFASRQINACYEPAQRLEPLYRLNRRHALANSPLRVRIGVMRRIQKMEAGSAKEVAGRQVELFEAERIKGVRTELDEAQKAQDLRRLNQLCVELSSKEWLKSPDQVLVRNAVKALRQEEARRARLRMVDLAGQLQNAWSAQDFTEARQIREQWEACQKSAQRPDNDQLMQETRAAFSWLKDIDNDDAKMRKYDDAVTQLTESLDQRKTKEFLEPLAHALNSSEDGMPAALRTRLQSRYDELETESHRKNLRRLIVTSLSVVCVAALFIFVLHRRGISDRTEGHISSLTTLLERGDVDAAETYVGKLEAEQPEMLQVPGIQMLVLAVSQTRTDEDARKAAFDSSMQSLSESLVQATTLAEAKNLKERLDAVNWKGKTEDDAVEQLLAAIQQKQQEIQTQIDTSFELALQEAAGEFESYKKNGTMDAGTLQGLLTTFRELAQKPDVSSELIAAKAGPGALAMQCETLIFESSLQTKQVRLLKSVTDSIGEIASYRAALDAYAKEFPKDPLGLHFESLLRTEADGWGRVDEINKFVDNHSIDCTRLSPAQARVFVSESQLFLTMYPEFPRAAELKKIADYLQFVSQRIDEDGMPVHGRIVDLLMKANLEDLYVVMLATGERSYTNKEPEVVMDPPRMKLFPLTDWLAVARQRDERPKYFPYATVSVQIREGKPYWDAPESVLIRDIVRDFRTIDDHDWERVMIDQLQRVFDQTRQDPIFRLFMLRTILDTATAGSPVISQHYSKIQKELNDTRLDGINPFDPDDESTNLIRKRVTDLLKPFEDPAALPPALTAYREMMAKVSIRGRYRWVAWLNLDSGGWRCESDKVLADRMTGPLFVYVKSSSGTSQFRTIGTAKDGKCEISAAAAPLSEGMPVYLYEE